MLRIFSYQTTKRERLYLLAGAAFLMLLLTVLFPQPGFREYVYEYGFPDPFFTHFTRQFHSYMNIRPHIMSSFAFDPLQMAINIVVVYLPLLLLYKLCCYFIAVLR